MKVKADDILVFRGLMWDEHWDFDAPIIVYSPVTKYSSSGSVCATSIVDVIEDACIDLCLGADLPTEWSEGALKEFAFRGWDPKEFGRRKTAIHAEVTVKFVNGTDGLEFDYLAAAAIDGRSGGVSPIFAEVPARV